tara:strand:- start:801 stop:1154 length:354 start_codon:yes stop_codon:yes gene_type:complete
MSKKKEYYLNPDKCKKLIDKLQTDKVCLTDLVHENSAPTAVDKGEVLELLCEHFVTIRNFLEFLKLTMDTSSKVETDQGEEYLITDVQKQTLDLYNGTIILLELHIQQHFGIILTRQ